MMSLTDRATIELRRLLDDQPEPDFLIRVFVQGACGCGAARYGMGLENQFTEDETVQETAGIKLVVDPDSVPYLEGVEIDYNDGLMGRGFTITNPNRPSGGGCGCGR